ncbi:MAG: hypothetical protein ACXWM7_06855 [Parachlamydiaceae bacterium]
MDLLRSCLQIACLLSILASCRTVEIIEPAGFDVQSVMVVGDGGKMTDDPLRFSYEEVSDLDSSKNKGGFLIRLITGGFPSGTRVHLKMTKVDGTEIPMGDYEANEEGELVALDQSGQHLLRNAYIPVLGHMCGEETTYTLVSLDGNIHMSVAVGNDPIRAMAKDGAVVSIVMRSGKADLFSIEGKSFLPNEELHIVSKSGSEEVSSTRQADETGAFMGLIAPGVKGMTGGPALYAIRRMNGEVLTLDYAWGEEAKRRCHSMK